MVESHTEYEPQSNEEFEALCAAIDSDVQAYKEKVTTGLEASLAKGVAPYQRDLAELQHLYLTFAYVADHRLVTADFKEEEAIQVLFGRVAHGLRGVRSCLAAGDQIDAAAILRSIFEAYATLKLIMEKDYSARVRLFFNWSYGEKVKAIRSQRELVERGDQKQEDFERIFPRKIQLEIEKAWDEVKAGYGRRRTHWAWGILGKSDKDKIDLKRICDHLGILHDYHSTFSVMSGMAVHSSGSPTAFFTYGGGLSLAPKFSEMTPQLVRLSVAYAAKFLELFLGKNADKNARMIWYLRHLILRLGSGTSERQI